MKIIIPKLLLFLFFCLFTDLLSAQELKLQGKVLPQYSFKKIVSDGTNLWALSNDNKIFQLDADFMQRNITAVIRNHTSSEFTCIEQVGIGKILIGTKDDYVYKYDNGLVTKIDTSNGLTQSTINSIVNTGVVEPGSTEPGNVTIGTGKNIFGSDLDFQNYRELISVDTTTSDSFQCFRPNTAPLNNSKMIFSYYDKQSKRYQGVAHSPPTTYIMESLPNQNINAIYVQNLLSTGDGLKFLLGSNKGLFESLTNKTYNISKVNDIVEYNHVIYIATHKGMFTHLFLPSQQPKQSYTENNLVIYDLDTGQNYLYAATNQGILVFTHTINCEYFKCHFEMSTSTVYVAQNIALIPRQGLSNIHWDFGNGVTSNVTNPVISYNAGGIYNICMTSTDSFCTSDTFCREVTVLIPVGIQQETKNISVNVFPNPVMQGAEINISIEPASSYSVRIIDIFGRVIKEEDHNTSEMVIDRNLFSPGIYSVAIMKQNEVVSVRKMIVE
jgi:hypothetical protein